MKALIKNLTVVGFFVAMVMFVSALSAYSQEVKPEIADALKRGDTTLAIDLLNRDIELDKSYHLNYYTLGMIYYNRMQYQKAIEQFGLALDRKKKDFESVYYLGLCYLATGDLTNADKMMQEGVKKDRENKARFEDGLGQVAMARKDYTSAEIDFRKALIEDSTNPMYHIHLGDNNFFQGVFPIAITEYEKALQMDTASTEVYYHWAEACLGMKDYNCALEKLRVVLTKDSTYAYAWMRAGGIYFKAALSSRSADERNTRFKEAIGSYKRYIELSGAKPDSTNARVYFELAMSYSNLYGFEDAAIYFEQVLAVPIEPRDIYFHYGKSLFYNKQYEKAAEMLLKHIDWATAQTNGQASGVSNAELYQLLGDCYFYRQNRDYASAVNYYAKSLEADANQKRVLANIAIAYHSLKSYSQAIQYYDKRIEIGIDSNSASILKNAASCALNLAGGTNGGDDNIDIDEETTGEVQPETVTVDPNVNYYAVAVGYLANYLSYNPADTAANLRVATTYLYQLNDCTNGILYFDKVLALDPTSCDAKKSLGYAYFAQINGSGCNKNYTKALSYLTDAYSCISKSQGACSDVNLVLWIAQCYHLRAVEKATQKQNANDDFKNAHTWYGNVLKCQPNHPEATKGQNDVRFEFAD